MDTFDEIAARFAVVPNQTTQGAADAMWECQMLSLSIDDGTADDLVDKAEHTERVELASGGEQTTFAIPAERLVGVLVHAHDVDTEWLHLFAYADEDAYASGLASQTPPAEIRADYIAPDFAPGDDARSWPEHDPEE